MHEGGGGGGSDVFAAGKGITARAFKTQKFYIAPNPSQKSVFSEDLQWPDIYHFCGSFVSL